MASSQYEDAEMVKLQKKIRQQQRRGSQQRGPAAKLTPAEVRSLALGVTTAKDAGTHSLPRMERSSSNTPPLSPETTLQHQLHETAGADLPTPPQSPQTPTDQKRDFNPTNGHVHIHAPKPQPYTVSPLVHRGPSRPSSASSYRGISTYRGPEVTRTGSMTMFRQPPADIVSNPLSQFSRPRRSTTGNSPDRSESRNSVASTLEHNASANPSHTVLASTSARHAPSPTKTSESSNSMVTSQGVSTNSVSTEPEVTSAIVGTKKKDDMIVAPFVESKSLTEDASSKSHWSWRRSMTHHQDEDKDIATLKKGRRRTMSFSSSTSRTNSLNRSVPYSATQAGVAPEMKKSLKAELPSAKGNQAKDQDKLESETTFEPHPTVRPLSVNGPRIEKPGPASIVPREQVVTPDIKGKGKDSGTAIYGRCSCCGKLRKPTGFHSELSPVIENENLRTNFSLEADRASTTSRRRSSSIISANRQKYTPIIPMPVSADKTVQASIEPAYDVITNDTGDIIATNAGPVITQAKHLDGARVSRFSSLHITKEEAKKLREEKRMSLQNARSTGEKHSFPELLAHQANTMVEQDQPNRISRENEPLTAEERDRHLQESMQDLTSNGDTGCGVESKEINGTEQMNQSKDKKVSSSNETSPQRRRPGKRGLSGILKWRRGSTSELQSPKSSGQSENPTTGSTVSLVGNGSLAPAGIQNTPGDSGHVAPSDNISADVSVVTSPQDQSLMQQESHLNASSRPGSRLSTSVNNQSSHSSRPESSVSWHPATDSYQKLAQNGVNVPSRQSSSKPYDRNVHQLTASTGTSHGTNAQSLVQQASSHQQATQRDSNPNATTLSSESQFHVPPRPQSQPSTHIYHPRHILYNDTLDPHSRPLTSPPEPMSASSSTDYLPTLRFGPHFAHSSSTLNDFVMPTGSGSGKQSSHLVERVRQATSDAPVALIDQSSPVYDLSNGASSSGGGWAETRNGYGSYNDQGALRL